MYHRRLISTSNQLVHAVSTFADAFCDCDSQRWENVAYTRRCAHNPIRARGVVWRPLGIKGLA